MNWFIENYVCGSRMAAYLNSVAKNSDIKDGFIVFVRNPIDRFWSAVKKTHGYKKEYPNGLTSDMGTFVEDYKAAINQSISDLQGTQDVHFLPQCKNIESKTIVRKIFMNESFEPNVKKCLDDYNFSFIDGFCIDDWFNVNRNPQENDSDALKYIKEDKAIFGKLTMYYKDDFVLWGSQ